MRPDDINLVFSDLYNLGRELIYLTERGNIQVASKDYIRLSEHKSCSEINVYSKPHSAFSHTISSQLQPTEAPHASAALCSGKHLNHPRHDRIKTTLSASLSTNVDNSPWSTLSIMTPMIYMGLSSQYF